MFGYLISYAYYRDCDLDALAASTGRDELTFFADSGAFSAHTIGREISLAGYADWIERWRHRIHAYASLDVLFDAEATRANTEALRALGLDPVPVFHLGSPMAAFKRYLEEGSYVAVGGIASGTLSLRDPRLWAYLSRLHGLAQAAGVGLHGFGLSSWKVIRGFPWRSIDSSTPGMGYRYGRIQAFDPYTDRWHAWSLRDRRAWHRHGWLVREYGMTPDDFAGDNVAIRTALIQIAARSWSRAAAALSTETYIADPPPTPKLATERIAEWDRGNTWVYVVDAAMQQPQDATTRLAVFDQGNRWAAPAPV